MPVGLSEILYVDEAAKTASNALAMNYVLFVVKPDGQTMYVLADANEAKQSLAKATGKMSLFEWLTDVADVIKGMIVLDDDGNSKTVSVSNSAAIGGFGPLLYELAMADVSPKYLTTDSKVTPAALNVWSKFYERNDVKKIFLEELHDGECLEVMKSLQLAAVHLRDHINNQNALDLILARINTCSRNGQLHNPESFMRQLASHIDLKLLPMLFAYSMSQKSATARVLRNEGDILAAEIMNTFRINRGQFTSDLHSAAADFFSRLYKH